MRRSTPSPAEPRFDDRDIRLVAYTQMVENVGTDNDPCWRPVGTEEYVVARLSANEVIALRTDGIARLVLTKLGQRLIGVQMGTEYVLEWEVLESFEHTPYEQAQLDCDGEIRYPPKDITE